MNNTIRIGGPMFFLAIGLILWLVDIPGIGYESTLSTVGLIITVVSALALIIGIAVGAMPKKTVTEAHNESHVDHT